MTTILNTELLLSTLTSRIRELDRTTHHHTAASVLEALRDEIHAGEYDTPDNSDLDDLSIPMQDPLEAAADRIIGSSGFLDTVREIPVGDVVSVQTILYRRADEHEKQAAVIRERRAQMAEALQGLLSPEKQAEESTHAYAKMDEVRREEYYAATGLRDRNGGR